MTAKRLLRDPFLLFLLIAVLLVQLFAASPGRVEHWYSEGVYPYISSAFRTAFGSISFSVGDILYGAAALYLAWQICRGVLLAWRKQLGWRHLLRIAKVGTSVYLLFQLCWGLNYSRRDIAQQFDLQLQPSDTALLPQLAGLLQARLCTWGDRVDSVRRLRFQNDRTLFGEAVATYDTARRAVPMLTYRHPSIKASLFSPMGHLFGFTGYYNPFTGEAQVHTGIPLFLRPFVVCHEMGHQLGWARENEANFAGFLAGRHSADPDFVYSAYYEMYWYTLLQLAATDRKEAYILRRTAHLQVRKDYRAYLQYLFRTKNSMEPVVMKFYGQYLKLNNQKNGLETYDEVVLWLLAYYKKYGANAI